MFSNTHLARRKMKPLLQKQLGEEKDAGLSRAEHFYSICVELTNAGCLSQHQHLIVISRYNIYSLPLACASSTSTESCFEDA